MKNVFSDYSQIAHLWAHQQQDSARNSRHNFYFNELVIYSYGGHFPIARIDKKLTGTTVFFTLSKYSNSTAGHVNITRQAIPHDYTILYMKNVITGDYDVDMLDHKKNIDYWIKELAECFEKIQRARKQEIWIGKIHDITEQLKAYIEYFDLPTDASTEQLLKDANPESFNVYLEKENERIQTERKAKAKKEKQAHRAELAKFRSGKIHRMYKSDGFDYLRINAKEQTITTSQAVEIPIDAAKKFYTTIQAIIKKGGCNGNCKALLMKRYELREANKDFIIVGCHKVATKEYELLATKLHF